jgi:hypothetical protein
MEAQNSAWAKTPALFTCVMIHLKPCPIVHCTHFRVFPFPLAL